ncbi:uncharacterized protein LOC114353473 isoform X2 [Ostrinia furnacalis]|uniref:uncharacterized protein LOC114353473 isoform X2 n=1 Tax=Ostrinia furnacalis TaxID=93504 RepID=UPI00103BC21F|nr:uncharacterized protein LOC114353473 isoform X2 [Ostrinia furnacalis]
MELNELIAARGYVKGTITRLTSLVSTPQSVKNLSKENLMAKRQKLIDSFSQYEKLNIKILTIQPEDKENVELFEENYYNIISVIDQELNSRDNRNHSAPMSKLHLPPIDVPIFSDAYTSRAFQMERDATKEPTINTFLEYLDKRALALENADPGFHGQQRQPQKEQGNAVGRMVAYTAAQESTCLYCAAAYRAAGAA